MSAQVELFDDLEAVERDAGGALARNARASMFERLDWFRLVHEFTPPEGRPLVLRARNGKASAWLFLAVDGSSGTPLSNWYSLRYGPVIDGAPSEAALDELVRGLRRGGVHQISLSPMNGDVPFPAALRRAGWIARIGKSTVNWRIRTAGMSFEDYWASRPSRLRNTAKRRGKAAKLDLVVHDRFDAEAWGDYESVYDASWKPAEGSPELMRKLAEQEGAAGTLRLGLAYHEGRPVAAQLWTVEHRLATIHKLAYREDAKHLSPGTLLSMEMFRRVIDEDRAELIDFGIGDDGYKKDWMAEAVPLYELNAYDLRSFGGISAALRAGAAKLVRRVRSLYARPEQGLERE